MSSSTESDTEPAELAADNECDAAGIARQAIVDRNGGVFGYELFDRSSLSVTHNSASDARLLFNALSHADSSALIDNRILFVNCTHASLASGHIELVQPDRVVLELPPVDGNGAQAIDDRVQALTDVRDRGFRLAFNQTVLTPAYKAWLPLAAYIKIDLGQIPAASIGSVVALAKKTSDAVLVVEKVETAEQHHLAFDAGVALLQGFWFAKPVLIRGQTIRPAQAIIIQFINLVRKQATTAEIEEMLKRDASLSFNLLRFINSSGFGLRVQVTSFRHAVMILGLKKLFRWAALLLTTSRPGSVPSVVGATAIVRGRLMELLAAEWLPPEECDNAFVVGVFSLLDTMLGMPMDKALGAISLPESVISALLLRRGVLAPLLELAEACENADDEAFERVANELQLSNRQVNMAHLQALGWAESLDL